jgi:hypothetical protein
MTASAQNGHDHVLSVGVTIGPLILRVTVLAAMSVVAGYVLLSPFLAMPGRRASACGAGAAAVAVSFELLLSGGLGVPEQLVPLLLAGNVLPLYLLLSTDPRFARPVDLGRSVAPWVFVGMASMSAVVLYRAWFVDMSPRVAAVTLHTGVVLMFVTLAWFVVSPRRIAVWVLGAVLASALVLATTQAVIGQVGTVGAHHVHDHQFEDSAGRTTALPSGWKCRRNCMNENRSSESSVLCHSRGYLCTW